MSQGELNVISETPMPERQRRPKREEVRERLIEGAMRAFSIKGFAGASIDYICAQAGFSRGAFYSNFEDKDALFFALYDVRTDRLYARLEKIAATAAQSDAPLLKVAELLHEPDADELRWDILNKEFIVHALRNGAANKKLQQSRAGSKKRLAEILMSLKPDLADTPEKLDRLCRFIIALHEGELTQLGLEPALTHEPSLLAEFVPPAIEALLRQT